MRRNILKILTVFLLLLTFALATFSGCAKNQYYLDHVSQLRQDYLVGKNDNYFIKCGVGFTEQPFINDGKVGNIVYGLTVQITTEEAEGKIYQLSFKHNDNDYDALLQYNPVAHTIDAFIEIEDFSLKEFDLTVTCAGQSEVIKVQSVLPENTIDHKSALKHLYQQQEQLLKAYCDQTQTFNAEIYLRVIVKDEKSYWYVGIASGNDNLKALLIDGFNGQVLAIREIF